VKTNILVFLVYSIGFEYFTTVFALHFHQERWRSGNGWFLTFAAYSNQYFIIIFDFN